MFRLFFNDEDNAAIDKQIDAVLDEMTQKGVNHEDYPKLMTYLERLNKLKRATKRQPISLDTLVIAGGNFAIAFLIVAYEQKHVMTSKVPLPFTRQGKT